MHEFHRIVHREQPYTFFYAPKHLAAWNKRVRNVQIHKIPPQLLPLTWWIDE